MLERKAFNFYKSYYDVALEIPKKYRLQFIEAILEYQFNGVEPSFNGILKMAWVSQKHSLEKQLNGYKSGVKGGRPPKGTSNPSDNQLETIPNKGSSNQEQGQGKGQEKGQLQGEVKTPNEKEFVEFAVSYGKTEEYAKSLYRQLSSMGFKDADGNQISNWKRYTSAILNDPKNKDVGNQKDEEINKLYSSALYISQSRGKSLLEDEKVRNAIHMNIYKGELLKTLKVYAKLKQKLNLHDNNISEFLRNKGRYIP